VKNAQLSLIITVTIVVLAFLSVGCDEGMQITKPIIGDPITDPDKKDPTNTGI